MQFFLQRFMVLCLVLAASFAGYPVMGQNPADPIQKFVGEWDSPESQVSIIINADHTVQHWKWGRGDIRHDNADYFEINYRERFAKCHYTIRLYSQDELWIKRADDQDLGECDLGVMRRRPPDPVNKSEVPAGSAPNVDGAGPAPKVEVVIAPPKPHKSTDILQDCEECPEVVVMPGGGFAMGSPDSEAGRRSDEGPMHPVAVKQFAMGRYAVTRKQYMAFLTATGYNPGRSCRVIAGNKAKERVGYSFLNPGFPQDDAHPVVCVSWYDALAYVSWLSQKTGKPYRLPSEAEREYAARANTTTPYNVGATITTAVANFDPSAAPNAEGAYRGTVPVATFSPNGFGLYQMHGNVAEWTQDCWNPSYDNAKANAAAMSSGDCAKRVLRGGSWGYEQAEIRSAYREAAAAQDRYFHVGFRVAREETQ